MISKYFIEHMKLDISNVMLGKLLELKDVPVKEIEIFKEHTKSILNNLNYEQLIILVSKTISMEIIEKGK